MVVRCWLRVVGCVLLVVVSWCVCGSLLRVRRLSAVVYVVVSGWLLVIGCSLCGGCCVLFVD